MTTVSALVVFGVAMTVSIVATPLLRRLALRTDFIDQPGAHKSHSTPVPYLGGLAIMAGTLAGSAVGHRFGLQAVAIGLAAACLGSMGLLDDSRHLSARSRLVVQLVAAFAVAGFGGVRAEVSGIVAFDVLFTVVWILAITNAVNFLDNMDGLAAGITATAGMAIFATAALSGQTFVATVALAMVGACIGFLPFNASPAKIYMGDAGSLFLGFLLAVLTLDVKPELVPPASFVVPALLVALPVLDITTVTVSRLRRGIRVSTGGRNHLSHRLVARGLSRPRAVAVLIGVEAVVAALAILPNRDPATLSLCLLGATIVLGGLTAYTLSAPVHEEPVIGFSRRILLLAVVACVAVLGAVLPAMATVVGSLADLDTGASHYHAAAAAACRGDREEAARLLERSGRAFLRADLRLGHPAVSLALAVPVVNSNVSAARALADTGRRLQLETDLRVGLISATSGRMPPSMTPLAASPPYALAQTRLKEADAPFLLPAVHHAVTRLATTLDAPGLSRPDACLAGAGVGQHPFPWGAERGPLGTPMGSDLPGPADSSAAPVAEESHTGPGGSLARVKVSDLSPPVTSALQRAAGHPGSIPLRPMLVTPGSPASNPARASPSPSNPGRVAFRPKNGTDAHPGPKPMIRPARPARGGETTSAERTRGSRPKHQGRGDRDDHREGGDEWGQGRGKKARRD
jgi:UDP-GlcNAc:undecaprenyl-phosphate/decaprenyl-phosphate GlcNAc-1-phosphate transferase